MMETKEKKGGKQEFNPRCISSVLISSVVDSYEGEKNENDRFSKKGRAKVKEVIEYEGEFEDGYFSGKGRIRWVAPKNEEVTYSGGVIKNEVTCKNGEMRWMDGGVYTGSLIDGDRSGEGKYVNSKLGKEYSGSWKDNKKSGTGKLSFSPTSWYEGSFKNNSREGYGELVYESGNKYLGTWKTNKKHGDGVLLFKREEQKYVGKFVDGEMSGLGHYTYYNFLQSTCNYYVGNFLDGKKEGDGELYFSDGSMFIGRWKNNKKVGKGIYLHVNGVKEVMSFRNDKILKKQILTMKNLETVLSGKEDEKEKEEVNHSNTTTEEFKIMDLNRIPLYINDVLVYYVKKEDFEEVLRRDLIFLERLIIRYSSPLLRIYDHYCKFYLPPEDFFERKGFVISKKREMTLKQFLCFANDCKLVRNDRLSFVEFSMIVKRTLSIGKIDLGVMFDILNNPESEEKRELNVETGVEDVFTKGYLPVLPDFVGCKPYMSEEVEGIRFRDFVEVIVRIALRFYYGLKVLSPKDGSPVLDAKKQKIEREDLSSSCKKLIKEIILPNFEKVESVPVSGRYLFISDKKDILVENFLKKNHKALVQVFEYHRIRENFDIIKKTANVTITMRKVCRIFGTKTKELKFSTEDLFFVFEDGSKVSPHTLMNRELLFDEFVHYFYHLCMFKLEKLNLGKEKEILKMGEYLDAVVKAMKGGN